MGTRSAGERETHVTSLRSPPVMPYRRYPSLSDDGQPYFPRFWKTSRRVEETTSESSPTVTTDRLPFPTARTLAAVAFVVLIVILLATA
jgi:hypothetical protein